VWRPADPDATAKLVPDGLTPANPPACYINQYVVDDAAQTSNVGEEMGFAPYSLTYLGVDLDGLNTTDQPGRFWTHYLNSSPNMIEYALDHGVPATGGRTELVLADGTLVATTFVEDNPIIRTTCKVELGTLQRASGQLRYITKMNGKLYSGRYPYIGDAAEHFEVESLEFLDPNHSSYQLRPAEPLDISFGFYSPSVNFCYPGGEGELGTVDGS
jgi:hypothetical protein